MAFNILEFRIVFLRKLFGAVANNLIPNANKRFRKYVKNQKTQDQPINANFETLVREAVSNALNELGIEHWTAVTEYRSDVHVEGDDFILQLDAKGCNATDHDFKKVKNGDLKIHIGEAQHSLTLDENEIGLKLTNPVRGKQHAMIDGKPVYTSLSFIRWGYTEARGYFAESIGFVNIPHEIGEDIYAAGGKSRKEARLCVKNSDLYELREFS